MKTGSSRNNHLTELLEALKDNSASIILSFNQPNKKQALIDEISALDKEAQQSISARINKYLDKNKLTEHSGSSRYALLKDLDTSITSRAVSPVSIIDRSPSPIAKEENRTDLLIVALSQKNREGILSFRDATEKNKLYNDFKNLSALERKGLMNKVKNYITDNGLEQDPNSQRYKLLSELSNEMKRINTELTHSIEIPRSSPPVLRSPSPPMIRHSAPSQSAFSSSAPVIVETYAPSLSELKEMYAINKAERQSGHLTTYRPSQAQNLKDTVTELTSNEEIKAIASKRNPTLQETLQAAMESGEAITHAQVNSQISSAAQSRLNAHKSAIPSTEIKSQIRSSSVPVEIKGKTPAAMVAFQHSTEKLNKPRIAQDPGNYKKSGVYMYEGDADYTKDIAIANSKKQQTAPISIAPEHHDVGVMSTALPKKAKKSVRFNVAAEAETRDAIKTMRTLENDFDKIRDYATLKTSVEGRYSITSAEAGVHPDHTPLKSGRAGAAIKKPSSFQGASQ